VPIEGLEGGEFNICVSVELGKLKEIHKLPDDADYLLGKPNASL
jgi:hypothetical protein